MNSLKNKADKLDIHKLKPVPIDLKTLCNVPEKEIVKKTVYNALVKKSNSIYTSVVVKKHILMLRLIRLKVKYLALLV